MVCQVVTLGMTPSVVDEVSVPSRPGAGTITRLVGASPGITLLGDPVQPLSRAVMNDLERLHAGERDCLHHCLNGTARFVIVDDGRAVRFCRRYGIAHINALLCPRLLCFSDRLSAAAAGACFSRIAALGRYSTQVVQWAERCGPSDLAFFLGIDPYPDGR